MLNKYKEMPSVESYVIIPIQQLTSIILCILSVYILNYVNSIFHELYRLKGK